MNKVIDEIAVVHNKNMDQIKQMEIPKTLRYIVSFDFLVLLDILFSTIISKIKLE
jgi:hypothetical protein